MTQRGNRTHDLAVSLFITPRTVFVLMLVNLVIHHAHYEHRWCMCQGHGGGEGVRKGEKLMLWLCGLKLEPGKA